MGTDILYNGMGVVTLDVPDGDRVLDVVKGF